MRRTDGFVFVSANKKPCNRPLPSSKNPHFLVKMSYISMRMKNGLLFICKPTGSPSSKYERQRASALLHNILNVRTCMEKNLSFLKPTKNERISIKNGLPYIKCVFHLSCVVHGPIYRLYCKRFINIQRNPFTAQLLKRP